jgi:histidinol phosphatase-like enzyme
MRKPNIGMALKARRQFPEIRFSKSVMAGDSISDMFFGKRAGMKTVLISTDSKPAQLYPRQIDYLYPDLISLANAL